MPRIRVKDEHADLCRDCFDGLSDQDKQLIANLLYCGVWDIEESLSLEPDGAGHPSYEKEECTCVICDVPLTEEDDKHEDDSEH